MNQTDIDTVVEELKDMMPRFKEWEKLTYNYTRYVSTIRLSNASFQVALEIEPELKLIMKKYPSKTSFIDLRIITTIPLSDPQAFDKIKDVYLSWVYEYHTPKFEQTKYV